MFFFCFGWRQTLFNWRKKIVPHHFPYNQRCPFSYFVIFAVAVMRIFLVWEYFRLRKAMLNFFGNLPSVLFPLCIFAKIKWSYRREMELGRDGDRKERDDTKERATSFLYENWILIIPNFHSEDIPEKYFLWAIKKTHPNACKIFYFERTNNPLHILRKGKVSFISRACILSHDPSLHMIISLHPSPI